MKNMRGTTRRLLILFVSVCIFAVGGLLGSLAPNTTAFTCIGAVMFALIIGIFIGYCDKEDYYGQHNKEYDYMNEEDWYQSDYPDPDILNWDIDDTEDTQNVKENVSSNEIKN